MADFVVHRQQPAGSIATSLLNSSAMSSAAFSSVSLPLMPHWHDCSPPASDSRASKHMEAAMRNFLVSDPVRRSHEPTSPENPFPHHHNSAQPLPEAMEYPSVVPENEWSFLYGPNSDPTVGIPNIVNKSSRPMGPGTDVSESRRRSNVSFSPPSDKEVSKEANYRFGGARDGMPQRTVSMSFSDSGFWSVDAATRFHESPFMGFDSPSSSYGKMDWPDADGTGKAVNTRDAAARPRTMNTSSKVRVTESTPSGQPMTPSPYATRQPADTNILPSGQGLVSPPARPFPSPARTTALTPAGYQTILKTVVEPMMMNHSLSRFRSVFEQVLLLMQQGSIPTLRDLEKMLLVDLGQHTNGSSASSFLRLCYEFLERSRQSLHLLQEVDRCGPNEMPYDTSYFTEAWLRAIRTAQITFEIGGTEAESIASRIRTERNSADDIFANGRPESTLSEAGKKRQLGGLLDGSGSPKRARSSVNAEMLAAEVNHNAGRVLMCVSTHEDGTTGGASFVPSFQQAILAGSILPATYLHTDSRVANTSPSSPSTVAQSDASTSPHTTRRQSRNKKNEKQKLYVCEGCNESFPRPCDLTKHQKTHDRPYKCPEPSCSYSTKGFSAEKDKDRHYRDRHDKDAPKKECDWKCGYMSLRESNVKQHMEKVHGYVYNRTKGKPGHKTKVAKPAPPRSKNIPPNPQQATPSAPQTTMSTSNTPMVPNSGSFSSTTSPELFDLYTPSPQTMGTNPSPKTDIPRNYFPPLSTAPTSPPSEGISPEVITSAVTSAVTSPLDFTSSSAFRSPSKAVEAMNAQNRTPSEEMPPTRWESTTGALNPNAMTDSLFVGEELTPDSDFADTFLRDAPRSVWDTAGEAPAHDPELPVVQQYYYDPDRDRDYS